MEADSQESSFETTHTRPPGWPLDSPSESREEKLSSTHEARALPGEETVFSEVVPSTVGPTQSWDWPTLRRLADELPATGSRDPVPPAPEEPDRTLPVRPPFQIDGYDVLEKLGQGGMGIVYKARKLNLDVLVALKVLPPGYASDPDRLERFLLEGRMAAKLNDPHLLGVTDIEWADGVPVLVMPLVDGGDLAKLIKGHRAARRKARGSSGSKGDASGFNRRQFIQKVMPLLDQIVAGMGALHAAGILHRDIKPSNCLVDQRGALKLSDFGLARLKEGQRFTTHHSGLGTPGFMSPEAWEGRADLDERADVFSLGVTIYQAVTFELPYERARLSDTTRVARKGFGKGIPEIADLEPLILRAIEPLRSERYGSEEFREDWVRVRQGFSPKHFARVNPVRRGWRWVKRRRVAATATGSVGFAAVCIALLGWLWPRPPVDPMAPQDVAIRTIEPCSRYAFVPLNENTGEPDPESPHVRRGVGNAREQIRESLRPGEYLFVFEWPDGAFHEVNRRVPYATERPNGIVSSTNFRRDGRLVLLDAVAKPRDAVWKTHEEMTQVNATRDLRVWMNSSDDSTAYNVDVDSFWIDAREFSMDDLVAIQRAMGETPHLPRGMSTGQPYEPLPPGNTAVFNVEQQEAAHFLELDGKRLPTWHEMQSILRGNYQAGGWVANQWPILEVDDKRLDVEAMKPPLHGIRSNMAEWTSSTGGLGSDRVAGGPVSIAPNLARMRLVFGAPASVIESTPDPAENPHDLRARYLLPREGHWGEKPGRRTYLVGFRGVRSARPRFLDPD